MTGNCVSTLPLVILLALSLQFLRCTPVSLICHLPFLQLPLPCSLCPCHFLHYFELSLIISFDHHLVADCCLLLPHSACTHTLCNVWLYGNFTCWAINTQQLLINTSEQDVSTWRSLWKEMCGLLWLSRPLLALFEAWQRSLGRSNWQRTSGRNVLLFSICLQLCIYCSTSEVPVPTQIWASTALCVMRQSEGIHCLCSNTALCALCRETMYFSFL